jgi:hypothetical protein
MTYGHELNIQLEPKNTPILNLLPISNVKASFHKIYVYKIINKYI